MNQENTVKPSKEKGKISDGVAAAGMIGLGFAIVAIVAFLAALLVRWLWNRLMPGIFNLPSISYWQAFGVLVLAQILFGGGIKYEHGGKKPSKPVNKRQDPIMVESDSSEAYQAWWDEEGKQAYESFKRDL